MNSLRATAVIAALLVCATSTTSAQARPDFSGRWTTDPDPAVAAAQPAAGQAGARGAGGGAPQRAGGGAPGQGRGARGDMGSGWGPTITIRQDAAMLTVEYAFFGRGDMQPPLRFTYALDGKPTANTVMMGRGMQTQTARAAWEGDKLVLTSMHTLTDPATGKPVPAEVKQTLTLESPTSLVLETVRAGVLGGSPTTSRSVYRKITQP